MMSNTPFSFDKQSLDLFNAKGLEPSATTPNPNAVKVKRVIQIISDLSKKPFDQLEILDLACGEGVYALECAVRQAKVRAIDGRSERMSEGEKSAIRNSLHNLTFEINDIRNITIHSHGKADVILLLGILYHLDYKDVLPVLRNLFNICTDFLIIDTHIALANEAEVVIEGRVFRGRIFSEHSKDDSKEVRQKRQLASLDNENSFWFTKPSLIELLEEVGFTSVNECHIPAEPGKPKDRITLVAHKGSKETVFTYPWLNELDQKSIERTFKSELSYPKDFKSHSKLQERFNQKFRKFLSPLRKYFS